MPNTPNNGVGVSDQKDPYSLEFMGLDFSIKLC